MGMNEYVAAALRISGQVAGVFNDAMRRFPTEHDAPERECTPQ
jgi:hypothetical protein